MIRCALNLALACDRMSPVRGPRSIWRLLRWTTNEAAQLVTLDLPAGAIQLLYDVLGHFPHDPVSWSHDARGRCSEALVLARESA